MAEPGQPEVHLLTEKPVLSPLPYWNSWGKDREIAPSVPVLWAHPSGMLLMTGHTRMVMTVFLQLYKQSRFMELLKHQTREDRVACAISGWGYQDTRDSWKLEFSCVFTIQWHAHYLSLPNPHANKAGLDPLKHPLILLLWSYSWNGNTLPHTACTLATVIPSHALCQIKIKQTWVFCGEKGDFTVLLAGLWACMYFWNGNLEGRIKCF